MDESQMIADGIKLGFKEIELQNYVKTRIKQSLEHEQRALDRESQKQERELELKKIELEIARSNRDAEVGMQSVQSNKADIKLTPYKDSEDIGVYLRTFEKVKKANGWTESIALSALINGFTNTRVSLFLDNISPEVGYTEIKTNLLRSFGLTIYDYQNKFRSCKQSSESFSQLVVAVRENLNKMCTLANVNKKFEHFEELVVKDQILRSVDRSLSEYLREKDLFSLPLDEVIKLAENFQAVHGKPGSRYKNHNFRPDSRHSNIDVASKVCFNCKKPGHLARNCIANTAVDSNACVSRDNKARANESVICYSCKQPGHYSKDCKQKSSKKFSKNELGTVKVSFATNYESFNHSNLPVVIGKCNGKDVRVLRDTVATAILLKTELIRPDKFTGKWAEVNFADGRSSRAKIAVAKLDCAFYSGTTEAICLDNLPFDVLVGNVQNSHCPCVAGNYEKNISTNSLSNSGLCYDESVLSCMVQTRAQKLKDDFPDVTTKICDLPVKLDMTNLSTTELISLQLADPKLKPLRKKIDTVSNSYPRFTTQNGVMIRLSRRSKKLNDVIKQIVLPTRLKTKVMSLGHDTVMSGHLGIAKTQARVLNHFYWPGVYADISRYCKSCESCQKSSFNKPPKVPLINLPVIGTPFSRVSLDIIGPLPRSSKGNRFALVSVDLATKYPDAVPLKRIDSETVAEAMLDIYARVGLPNEILHDQGTQFMSSVMKKFNQLLQIKSVSTTPYNPRCNGSCENFNKCLKQMLRKVCDDEPVTWDRYLQPLLFAYREVPQTSTGFSPFELLFGHEVRGPLFLIKERILEVDCDPEELPVTSYVMKMRDKVKAFMKLSNEQETSSKKKEKHYYDRTCRKRQFKMNDKVLLLLPTSSNKLLAEWKGPYEVARRINKVDYVIRMGDKEKTFHINMLKPYYERVQNACNFAVSEVQCDSPNFKINEELSNDQQKSMLNVLECNSAVFSNAPGKISGIEYDIVVDDKVKPISCQPYKVPFHLKDKVKQELNTWLEQGIIQESSSPFAFPVVIVSKNNSIRLTIDFRKLNPHVTVDNYPMPHRDEVIEKLANAKYLTKLDLTKAYFQIPLTESSRKYTSFVTPFGQYEFLVVPFGIRFASGLCNTYYKCSIGAFRHCN